jgi:hypothetical protein
MKFSVSENNLRIVKYFEEYYGEYRPLVKASVLKWLQEKNFSKRYLSALSEHIVKTISTKWKTPPSIKELEDAHTEVVDTWKPPAIEENQSNLLDEIPMDPEIVAAELEKLRKKLQFKSPQKRDNKNNEE